MQLENSFMVITNVTHLCNSQVPNDQVVLGLLAQTQHYLTLPIMRMSNSPFTGTVLVGLKKGF